GSPHGPGTPPQRPPASSGAEAPPRTDEAPAHEPAPAQGVQSPPEEGEQSGRGAESDGPPPGGPPRLADEPGSGPFTGDPLRDLAAFLRAEADRPAQLDARTPAGDDAERMRRFAAALGLEAVFGELRDPAAALAELAEIARARGFLDDVENAPRMRYPADFAELTATERYGDEEYWHNEADPETAREIREELRRAGL